MPSEVGCEMSKLPDALPIPEEFELVILLVQEGTVHTGG